MPLDPKFVADMKARLTKERDGLKKQLARIATKDGKTPGDCDATWPSYNEDDRDSRAGWSGRAGEQNRKRYRDEHS
ncbi:MAG: hypothetical protein U0514_03210 [Candidatus Andersenbacteria bacterium]